MKSFLMSSTNSMFSWLSNLLCSSNNSENEREMVLNEDIIEEIPRSSENSVAESVREMVLTEDLVEEIILRLPIKSLVRCKSLSKKWHFLISESPSFRRIYFSRMIDTSPHMLGFFCSRPLHIHLCGEGPYPPAVRFLPTCKEGLMLKRGEETWGAPPFDNSLSFMSQGDLSIMASSGSFLLCSLQSKNPLDYFICNPITKKWVALPKPSFTRDNVVHGLAICQDEAMTCYLPLDLIKYKVFRAIWKETDGDQPTDAAIIEIFSSELNQWKALHLNSTSACLRPHFPRNKSIALREEEGVFVFYSSTLTIHSTVAAVVYDPRKDYLDLIEVPGEQLDNGKGGGWGLSQGCIHYARHDSSHFEIWTLEKQPEYRRREWSLKRKVNIQIPLQKYRKLLGPYIPSRNYYVEAFHPADPHLLFINYNSVIVLFNLEDSSIQLLSKGFQLADNFFLYAWPHWPPFFP